MISNLLKRVSSLRISYRFLSSSITFSYRQNLVSDLHDENLIDKTVSLYGWLQNRRMNSFGVLRDHSGLIQFFLPSSLKEERQLFKQTPVESCIHVRGLLRKRPEKDINIEKSLGHLEVSFND